MIRPIAAAEKLQDKVALITGGDSGIGRAVAIAFAKEGARLAIVYLNEHKDAKETRRLIEEQGGQCILIAGDIGDEKFCRRAVQQTVKEFGRLDILVNNAAEQHPQDSIEKITERQLTKTFRTNIFSMFFLAKAAMKYLKPGGVIINTTSVTAYKGSGHLLDYSATKGAITAFTRSLSQALGGKEDSGECRCARTDLDAAHSIHVPRGKGRDLWQRCPDGAGLASRRRLRRVLSFSPPTIPPI
jgi:NAD(P)-dependent dehydrogenase (short-subunit alcohol dehydrogenase family)